LCDQALILFNNINMKNFLSALIFLLMIIDCRPVYADETFQDFFNNCTYGVVTGVLIGGASLALAEDPGSSLAPITRGASLGLYAGAVVSVYKNWHSARRTRIDIGKGNENLDEHLKPNNKPDFMIIPQNQGMAVAFRWQL
jgi:hypothetical protein